MSLRYRNKKSGCIYRERHVTRNPNVIAAIEGYAAAGGLAVACWYIDDTSVFGVLCQTASGGFHCSSDRVDSILILQVSLSMHKRYYSGWTRQSRPDRHSAGLRGPSHFPNARMKAAKQLPLAGSLGENTQLLMYVCGDTSVYCDLGLLSIYTAR